MAKLTLNPFTGQFDIVGSSSGGGGVTPYNATIATGDFGHVGADYELSILASSHGVGVNPAIAVFDSLGNQIYPAVNIDDFGNITIRVSFSPDNRFNGKAIIK